MHAFERSGWRLSLAALLAVVSVAAGAQSVSDLQRDAAVARL